MLVQTNGLTIDYDFSVVNSNRPKITRQHIHTPLINGAVDGQPPTITTLSKAGVDANAANIVWFYSRLRGS